MTMLGTTVIGCVRQGRAAIASDGQVTLGSVVVKAGARKIRRLFHGQVLAGFAGGAADGLHLFERFETMLEAHHGQLQRAAVELAKEWRSDRVLRRLEAQLVALDRERAFLLTGSGDIIEPDDGLVAIGSGAPYALSAGRALIRALPAISASEIVSQGLAVAAEICIYTNSTVHLEEL